MKLLEREPLLIKLDGLLHEAAAGQGRLVFLAGEAGVGKSVLIQHFCGSVNEDVRLLFGACDSLSTPRPLGPLVDMAGSLGGELERILQGKRRRAGRR